VVPGKQHLHCEPVAGGDPRDERLVRRLLHQTAPLAG
jgi:hypothetical protein